MNKAFLKWAGGKGQLVEKILALMPVDSVRYVEPFVGSGIVALNVPHKKIIIGDTNPGLMALWRELQRDGHSFIDFAAKYFTPAFNTEGMYYEMRSKFNATWHSDVKGALFLYLNRHCFNGLCRMNSKGDFNVPFGRYKNPGFPREAMEYAWGVSKRMEVYEQGFEHTFELARMGDVFYCDPPYIPINPTSSFTAYSKDGFGMDQQRGLVNCAEYARTRGATVIISNNDVPLARELYVKATEIHEVQVAKKISCQGSGRKKLGEIIAVYRP